MNCLNIVSTWKIVSKIVILQCFVLLVCFTVFTKWYFIPVSKKYAEQLTNTAKYEKRITKIEPPAVTICFEPHFKQSVYDKYKITADIFFFDAYPDVMKTKTIKVS